MQPLASLTNLETLWLNNNAITDVQPLASLTTNLGWLYLRNNEITDVSPLVGLTNLTHLSLENNPLSAASTGTHIPAMQANGVSVSY